MRTSIFLLTALLIASDALLIRACNVRLIASDALRTRACNVRLTAAAPGDALPVLQLTPAYIRSLKGDDLCEAIEELEAAAANHLDDYPGQPNVQLARTLAVAHTCASDHELAADHAKVALEVGGPSAEMHFVLGVAAERRSAEDEALDEYEAALALEPRNWRVLFHVGKISLMFGWVDDAIDYFRQVAEINPEHAPTAAFLSTFDDEDDDEDSPLGLLSRSGGEVPDTGLPPSLDGLPLPDGIDDDITL